MNSSLRCHHPVVSHLVNLPPVAAADAFDVMILDPALAQFLIPAGALIKARPMRYDALRVLPATLFLGRRRRTLSVVLELLPWSAHRTELALRSTDRSWLPGGRGVPVYRAAATAALEVLTGLIESRLAAPDRRVGAHERRSAGAPTSTGPTPGRRHGGSAATDSGGKSG
jgi:hypothetical protein